MKAPGLQDPYPARPDDPDERPAITQNGGTRLRRPFSERRVLAVHHFVVDGESLPYEIAAAHVR